MVGESHSWWNDLYEWVVGATIGWSDLVVSGIILAVSIVVALIFSTLVFRRLLRLSIVAGANFDVKTVAAIRIPIAAFVLLAGL